MARLLKAQLQLYDHLLQKKSKSRVRINYRCCPVGDFLFVNDIKKGIHVVDNTDPTSPKYVHFWSIPGNQNFTIDGNILYADNGPHLLVIDIRNYAEIVFVRYIENTFFENLQEQLPEDALWNAYFECPDPSKGLVKEWVKMGRVNPNCRKI